MSDLQATDATKVIYLIKRRSGISRDELVAHWYANHMPPVIGAQEQKSLQGEPYALRYLVTLFADDGDTSSWDGMAHLWWTEAPPVSSGPHGTPPSDSFHERVEPYFAWPTREYVVLDGMDRLSTAPLTLNAPYPSTRSGFHKVSFLVKANAAVDTDTLHKHWLEAHVPNVRETLLSAGGFRYVVSLSTEPEAEFAGLAELYFPDESSWQRFRETSKLDGMENLVDGAGTRRYSCGTEMIGIP